MGRSTTLRIPEGIKLSSELVETLVELIGPYNEPLQFKDQNNVKKSISKRMLALRDAFQYMLSAYDSERGDLVEFAGKCHEALIMDIKDSSSSEKILGQYAQILVDILSHEFQLKPEEAKKQLNRAEQYNLLHEVRPLVATLSPITEAPDHFLLQYDEPIQAFTEKTISELNYIKNYSKKVPEIPDWFETIDPESQAFIIKAKLEGYKDSEVRSLLKVILRLWKEYAQYIEEHTLACIKEFSITNNTTLLPKWDIELPEIGWELISDYLEKRGGSPFDIESQLALMGNKKLPDPDGLPVWYFFLEKFERRFLVQALALPMDLHEVSLSSRLRSLPGLANGARHKMAIINKDGSVVIESNNRYRGAHLVSRDNREWPLSLQGEYLRGNISLLPTDKSLLSVITLISPAEYEVARAWLTQIPDSQLQYILKRAFKSESKVDFVNLPVNYLGGYLPWQENLGSLIENYRDFLSKGGNNLLEELEPLLTEAEQLLARKVKGVAWHTVNLRLASIFHLIGQSLGTSFGSCVSGKDRFSVLLTYVDAMITYKTIYGVWPAFENGNNTNFNQLFMELLHTNHHGVLAHLNANGAEGLKHLSKYLSDHKRDQDIPWMHEQDLLASTNELVKICEKFKETEGIGERMFRCFELGRTLCSEINAKVYGIVQEERFWEKHNSPTVITEIQNVFFSKPSKTRSLFFGGWVGQEPEKPDISVSIDFSRSPETVLAETLECIYRGCNRYGMNRHYETSDFIDTLKPLIEPITPPKTVTEVGEEVEKNITVFFNEIKSNSKGKKSPQSFVKEC